MNQFLELKLFEFQIVYYRALLKRLLKVQRYWKH